MHLNEALNHVEGQVQLMAAALDGKAGALSVQDAGERLRECMVAFSGLSQGFGKDQFTVQAKQRLQAISETLALQREHLVRMGAITAQQAQSLVPQHKDAHTYGGVAASEPHGARASVSKLYHISG